MWTMATNSGTAMPVWTIYLIASEVKPVPSNAEVFTKDYFNALGVGQDSRD